MTEITEGMEVIRKTAATNPIIGTVQRIGGSPKPVARVHWQDSTHRWNGGTDTTSTVQVDALIPATDENIADVVAKSKRLTPIMKAALTYWREHYGSEYKRPYDAAAPLRASGKEDTYRRAFDKLASLGYLEPNPENKGKGSAYWTYRIAHKED